MKSSGKPNKRAHDLPSCWASGHQSTTVAFPTYKIHTNAEILFRWEGNTLQRALRSKNGTSASA